MGYEGHALLWLLEVTDIIVRKVLGRVSRHSVLRVTVYPFTSQCFIKQAPSAPANGKADLFWFKIGTLDHFTLFFFPGVCISLEILLSILNFMTLIIIYHEFLLSLLLCRRRLEVPEFWWELSLWELRLSDLKSSTLSPNSLASREAPHSEVLCSVLWRVMEDKAKRMVYSKEGVRLSTQT